MTSGLIRGIYGVEPNHNIEEESGMEFIKFKRPIQRINGVDYVVNMDNASILRQRRKHLGLTQNQVAEYAGIICKQYQRLESGERNILNASLRIVLPVCAVLKLDPYELFENGEKINKVIKAEPLEPERLPDMEIERL